MRRTDLTDAIAQYLVVKGLARYDPDGMYPAADHPLPAAYVNVGFPVSGPADAVTIRVYDDQRTRDAGTPDVYVQLRFRRHGEDPRLVENTADAVCDLLDDKRHLKLPNGIGVKLVNRKVAGMAEPDTSGKWQRPDSYLFTLDG